MACTMKRDGVRAIWNGSEWRSRADKPLYNIPPWQHGMAQDCEVFVGSFTDTTRATRTKHLKPDTPRIDNAHLYASSSSGSLHAVTDMRCGGGHFSSAVFGLPECAAAQERDPSAPLSYSLSFHTSHQLAA
jgi:hypothetical protein